mmetsp:Transcript_5190/g.8801  ORF Transcript_5190/g.8801 Transcript_5190/m.8801 type:complete len:226 (-) Transcript_5190:622-1299(-)
MSLRCISDASGKMSKDGDRERPGGCTACVEGRSGNVEALRLAFRNSPPRVVGQDMPASQGVALQVLFRFVSSSRGVWVLLSISLDLDGSSTACSALQNTASHLGSVTPVKVMRATMRRPWKQSVWAETGSRISSDNIMATAFRSSPLKKFNNSLPETSSPKKACSWAPQSSILRSLRQRSTAAFTSRLPARLLFMKSGKLLPDPSTDVQARGLGDRFRIASCRTI